MELITFDIISDDLIDVLEVQAEKGVCGDCFVGCSSNATGGSCGWGCYKDK